MNNTDVESILKGAGVSPTSNRVLVLRVIAAAGAPMSLMEITDALETLEKSSVFRVLTLLEAHGVIHTMEDGRGIAKYELCHCRDHVHSSADMHVHFYCTRCRQTFCLEDSQVPEVQTPEGFSVESVNFMLKGCCPACSRE